MPLLTPWFIALAVLLLYLVSVVNILKEYERGVIFRLGRLMEVPKGPGLIMVFWPIDKMIRARNRKASPPRRPKRISLCRHRSRRRRPSSRPLRRGARQRAPPQEIGSWPCT